MFRLKGIKGHRWPNIPKLRKVGLPKISKIGKKMKKVELYHVASGAVLDKAVEIVWASGKLRNRSTQRSPDELMILNNIINYDSATLTYKTPENLKMTPTVAVAFVHILRYKHSYSNKHSKTTTLRRLTQTSKDKSQVSRQCPSTTTSHLYQQ